MLFHVHALRLIGFFLLNARMYMDQECIENKFWVI